ncbi:MAG: hypothetical protein IJM59_12705 [Proteobacteria bacterium]|nr:hypothetical protein [Pseudomonadota bacterium]
MSGIPGWLKVCLHVAWGAGCLMWLTPAFADGCDNLDANNDWVSNFMQLNDAYKKEDWNTALAHGKELEQICDQSPKLNFTLAHIYKNMGDAKNHLYYLQKSTKNTERFAVDKDLLNRIWSEKYITENPDADPDNIKALKLKIETLENELEHANLSKDDLARSSISKEEHLEVQINDYRTPMWIATGIGIGGLAIAGTGAALAAISESTEFIKDSGVPGRYKENKLHTTGWILLGVGSGLAVSGIIFAGIFGYKYKHFKDNQALSLNFSPTYTSVSIDF